MSEDFSVYLNWYPADYLSATVELSLEEDAVYRRLLDAMWLAGGSLPSDEERLRRKVRASAEEWGRCRWLLAEYFVQDGDTYRHNRLDKELAKARERHDRARNNGAKGGRRAKVAQANDKQEPTETEANANPQLSQTEPTANLQLTHSLAVANPQLSYSLASAANPQPSSSSVIGHRSSEEVKLPLNSPRSTRGAREIEIVAKDGPITPAETLYELYPRKVAKQDALKAIEKALKAKPFAVLEEAVIAYAAAVAEWSVSDRQFVPYPASWFNAGCYDDDRATWKRLDPRHGSPPPGQSRLSLPEGETIESLEARMVNRRLSNG